MNSSRVTSFRKTATCPSSLILLSYRRRSLSPEITTLVRLHLGQCDFCCAELPLLAHHKPPGKGEVWPPEMPINLRILAEALLGRTVAISEKPKDMTFEEDGLTFLDV
jgi:hypothetical protein